MGDYIASFLHSVMRFPKLMIILLYILHLQVKIQIIYIMLRQLLLLLLTVCYTLLCEMSSKVPQQQLWNDVKLHWSSCYLVFPAFWEFATRFVPRDLPSLESSSVSNENFEGKNIYIDSTSILRYVSLCNFLKSVLEKFFKTIELCQSSPFFLHFLESKKKSSKKCFNSHLINVVCTCICCLLIC